MSTKKTLWGIIGTGRIAKTFAQALQGCADAQLYAVASRTQKKADEFAVQFGIEKSYGSYEALAADENIDIVYIATPMASHFGDSLLCMKNGRNVLCEKSVSINSKQLDEMLGCAEENGVFFMEAMWMKCRPAYLKALEWVRSGRIGRVLSLRADLSNLVQYDAKDRLFDPSCGGGALLDLAVYPITLAADVLGSVPEKTECTMRISKGIDMSESITLDYGSAKAYIRSGFDEQLKNDAVITGKCGSIVFGEWFHCTELVTLLDKNGNELERSLLPVRVNGYEYEVEEAQRCLREGSTESSLVPHSSTAAVMHIMDRCRAENGFYYPCER